ncbi:hypothetical protein SOVF_180950, partial [Spinacia oleracea]
MRWGALEGEEKEMGINVVGVVFIDVVNGVDVVDGVYCCLSEKVEYGVGILSVPYALASGGWLSVLLLFAIAVAAFYAGLLIKRCMEVDPSITSFPDIGERAFGNIGRTVVTVFMCAELYLVVTGFLIVEGDNLHNLFPKMNFNVFGLELGGRKGFVLIVALLITPSVWLSNISILSYISATGVIASVMIIISVLWVGTFEGIGFHSKGTKTLDREILGFDENWRPVCTQPPPPKGKYDTISTYSTRASSRRSTATVAKNRVAGGSKTKSSSVSIPKTVQPPTMQSNPTGHGGKTRKRLSLTSGRFDPTKKSKAADGDDVSAAVNNYEFPADDILKKTADSAVAVHPSPQPSIEILDVKGGGGENEALFQHCATSAA